MNTVDRAGIAVKSTIDGNIGITASGVDSSGNIDIMLLGGIGIGIYPVSKLEITELVEK